MIAPAGTSASGSGFGSPAPRRCGCAAIRCEAIAKHCCGSSPKRVSAPSRATIRRPCGCIDWTPVRDLPGYAQGWFIVQDQSAMPVATALAPKPGMRVLDMCAAPGGKTTHLAELMRNQGEIIACDVDARRLQIWSRQVHGSVYRSSRRSSRRETPRTAAAGPVRCRAGRCAVQQHRRPGPSPRGALAAQGRRWTRTTLACKRSCCSRRASACGPAARLSTRRAASSRRRTSRWCKVSSRRCPCLRSKRGGECSGLAGRWRILGTARAETVII